MKSLAIAACILVAACQKGDDGKKQPPVAAEQQPPAAAEPAPADKPAAIGADDMATVDAMAEFIAGLRGAIEQNRGDCDRVAAALGPVVERGRPVLDKARALEARLAGDEAARSWVQAHVEKKTGGFDGILTGLEGCADHPGVRTALEGFIE